MRRLAAGLGAIFAGALVGTTALAESALDQIQDEEQPGSEIEIDVGPGGNVEIGRKNQMEAPAEAPVELDGKTELQLPAGPSSPPQPDPVDDALPGEGPEDLSGPDDDDPLPE